MLRRNLSASWLFYGMQQEATLKPCFTQTAGNRIGYLSAISRLITFRRDIAPGIER